MFKFFCVICFFFLSFGIASLYLKASILSLVFSFCATISVLFFLYPPSKWVEDSFAAVSNKLKISSLVAGAVFLAASSSSPEFFASFSGVVLYKIFEIGLVTVLWSSLFNLCIIIGVCSLLKSPLIVNPKIIRRDMPFYGISILALIILSLDNFYTKYDFFILISIYITYVIFLYFDKSEPYKEKNNDKWSLIVAKMLFGLILIGILSHLLITFGLQIVKISEELFNYIFPVTLLAALIFGPGTSITDLMMSISATKKGEDSAAIGNGVGSNTFDLTICLGVPGLTYTFLIDDKIRINLGESLPIFAVVLIAYLVTFVFFYTDKKVYKWEGWTLNIYFLLAVILQIFISLK